MVKLKVDYKDSAQAFLQYAAANYSDFGLRDAIRKRVTHRALTLPGKQARRLAQLIGTACQLCDNDERILDAIVDVANQL